jgi:HTH-type transcriptional regulator / antitoxin HipB
VDYPVQLSSQLKQLLKSLRKSRKMTQSELARRLGVVQSRVADIERDPGAVSVEQLLQVLAMLGAQMVVREATTEPSATRPSIDLEAHAQVNVTATATLTTGSKPAQPTPSTPPDCPPPDNGPRGQW